MPAGNKLNKIVEGFKTELGFPSVLELSTECMFPSYLYKRGQDGTFPPNWKETVCGEEIPLLVLGDPT